MDYQRHFPTQVHFSAVISKGLSLVQWICVIIVQWNFSGIFQCMFMSVIYGVKYVALINGKHDLRNAAPAERLKRKHL